MSIPREESMRVLREGNVPDALIGAAFGVSHQRVGAILGKHAAPKPRQTRDAERALSDLPAFLREWRLRNRMNQVEAAGAAGVLTSTWNTWERGRVGCSTPLLLARYLLLLEKTPK